MIKRKERGLETDGFRDAFEVEAEDVVVRKTDELGLAELAVLGDLTIHVNMEETDVYTISVLRLRERRAKTIGLERERPFPEGQAYRCFVEFQIARASRVEERLQAPQHEELSILIFDLHFGEPIRIVGAGVVAHIERFRRLRRIAPVLFADVHVLPARRAPIVAVVVTKTARHIVLVVVRHSLLHADAISRRQSLLFVHVTFADPCPRFAGRSLEKAQSTSVHPRVNQASREKIEVRNDVIELESTVDALAMQGTWYRTRTRRA